ncbi:uncharacterized protein LOC109832114 [Asparagus officinalis]|uniref:uncharacterized protein LOC109832114 n=1 Tax=Asparagus officinalis TaxID=4686 RepID=UPI00098E7BDC|nr:uncharacterized protein LOC109832114 [Asparagus officinalis]
MKATSKLGKCLRAPIRVLTSVRDLYIKGMNGCAGRVQSAGALAYPSFTELNCVYSNSARSSASDDDLRELIRAASVGRVQGPVRRSQSVVVGRIDEDEPCEFKEDVKVGSDLLFPRSRSYAVGVKRIRTKVLV